MEEKFKIEIIVPENIVFSDETEMVILPSYEGDMGILKNHIPIITFLRPGVIKVKKIGENYENFFVEDGIVEFYNNNLSVLSSKAINTKNLSKDYLENLNQLTQEKIGLNSLTDEDRYKLNHKLDIIKSLSL